MAHRRTLAFFLACMAVLLSSGALSVKELPSTFRVMLQGESADDYSEIIEQVGEAGAEIIHRLPIINAVGARVSSGQLDEITNSAAVTRLIDDLDAMAPEPEEPADKTECGAAGALEIDYRNSGFHWRLYNKQDSPETLTGVAMEWPDNLGALKTVLWSGEPVEVRPESEEDRESRKSLTPTSPRVIDARDNIEMSFFFSQPVSPAEHPQRAFTLEAQFGEDCAVELIPGYADNSIDTYYPSVTGADLLHRHGITGAGITVAVLDSGLWEDKSLTSDTRGTHRVIARYNAVDDRADVAFDESGHGTHMTSIIAQSGAALTPEGGSFRGIAPDVSLVSVKAFEADGKGDFLNIVRGLQWVFDNRHKYDIRILNLSFAARPRWPYWLDPINQAIMRLWHAGVVVIAAAGNEGPGSMTVGSPGNLPYIITVGSVTDSWTTDTDNDDYIPDFSSRGPTPSGHIKPDIVAPGGHMSGITRPGSTLQKEFPEYLLSTGDFVMTGTSQSAAVVSGLAALLLETTPQLSPDEVKCALMSSANPAINRDGKLSYSPFQQGTGYVNIQRAITLGETGCGNAGMNIVRDMAGEEFFRGPAILDDIENPTLPDLELIHDGSVPEEGHSANRRWGVKAHVERLDPDGDEKRTNPAIPDWRRIYQFEKGLIDELRNGQ